MGALAEMTLDGETYEVELAGPEVLAQFTRRPVNPPIVSISPFVGGDLGQCCCCDQPANGHVYVCYSGDTLTPEPACGRHRKIAAKRDGRFFAHKATKARFMEGKLPTKPGRWVDGR